VRDEKDITLNEHDTTGTTATGALTDDELDQAVGGTEGPPTRAGDHNGSR
jgi:hypothetical protein